MPKLLTPNEVDVSLRYRPGRAKRLAKSKVLPCIKLPDGEIRFDAQVIERIASGGDPENISALCALSLLEVKDLHTRAVVVFGPDSIEARVFADELERHKVSEHAAAQPASVTGRPS